MPIRDLAALVEGLAGILRDPKKASIFHYICQMLPDDVQREFDHLAATSVSNGMMTIWGCDLLHFSLMDINVQGKEVVWGIITG